MENFITQIPRILEFIGDDPVVPYNVIYLDQDNRPVPSMGGMPYFAELMKELWLQDKPFVPYSLFAVPRQRRFKRGESERNIVYFTIYGFDKRLVEDKKIVVLDEYPLETNSHFATAGKLTRYLNGRPEISILDFRFVSTDPFHLYTWEEIYRDWLERRLRNEDEPPLEWDDIDAEIQRDIDKFAGGVSLNSQTRISVIETPKGTREAVGLGVYYLDRGHEVDYIRITKPEDVTSDDGTSEMLSGSVVIPVGPTSEIIGELEKIKGVEGMLHFDTEDEEE